MHMTSKQQSIFLSCLRLGYCTFVSMEPAQGCAGHGQRLPLPFSTGAVA